MTLNEYQIFARTTAAYPNRGHNYIYPTLGLVGEAGEISNKVKKIIRDKGSQLDDDIKKELLGELGDVLWYTAILADELGSDFDTVASLNITKLASRKDRGVIKGSGDHR